MKVSGIENLLFEASKIFLTPVLVLLCLMLLYALFSMGALLVDASLRLTRSTYQRKPLARFVSVSHTLREEGLELEVLRQLEWLRITSRVAPMLGLVATMIPMGPALVAVSNGDTKGMTENLVVAFSAVIVALLAAAVTYVNQLIRRRWLLEELNEILTGVLGVEAQDGLDTSHLSLSEA